MVAEPQYPRSGTLPSLPMATVLAGDRRQRGEDRVGQRGAAGRLEPVDRGLRRRVVGAGSAGGEGALVEARRRRRRRCRAGPRRTRGGLLRRGQPGRRDVVGAHAVRHVHGDDHRAGRAGDRDRGASARRPRPPAPRAPAMVEPEPELDPTSTGRRIDAGRGQRRGAAARRQATAPSDQRGHDEPRRAPASTGDEKAHAAPPPGRGDDLDSASTQVAVGADPVQRHPGAPHAAGQRGVALVDAGRGTGRGTAGRRSRPATARRSRRPRPRAARPRAASSSAASTTRSATTSLRCASRSSGRSHSPVPMKSETTTINDRRRARRADGVEHRREVGRARGRGRGRSARSSSWPMRSAWRRPVPGRHDPRRRRRRRAARRRGSRRGRTAGPAARASSPSTSCLPRPGRTDAPSTPSGRAPARRSARGPR